MTRLKTACEQSACEERQWHAPRAAWEAEEVELVLQRRLGRVLKEVARPERLRHELEAVEVAQEAALRGHRAQVRRKLVDHVVRHVVLALPRARERG